MTDRAIGSIPWTAVEQWSLAEDLDAEQRRIAHAVIGELDAEYLAWFGEQMKRAMDKGAKRPDDGGESGKRPRRGRPKPTCAPGPDSKE